MELSPQARAGRAASWSIPELVGLIAFLVVAGLIVWSAADVFLLIFIGLLFAILLNYLSGLVSKHSRLSHGWSLAVIVVALLILVGSLVGLAGARVAAETDNLTHDLQGAWDHLEQRASKYEWSRQLMERPNMEIFSKVPAGWLGQITGVFTTTFGVLSSTLLVVFIAIFTAANPELYRRGLIRLVPIRYRARTGDVLQESGVSLRWWIIGQFFSMSVVGLATAIGLWFLGIPFFVTLGILAGVLTFIPNFGPILSAVPAVLLALTSGPMSALYVVLLYIAVQAVESNLLTPLVQQSNVDLPPVLAVAVQILMGVLVGVLGLVVAAPLTVLSMILVKRFYVEGVLGDDLKQPG